MSLVTWEAIGIVATGLFSIVAMFAPFAFYKKLKQLEQFELGMIIFNFAFWSFVLCGVVGSGWSTIGIGLFGVTR